MSPYRAGAPDWPVVTPPSNGTPDYRSAVAALCRVLVRDCASVLGQPWPEAEVHAQGERIAALVLAEWRARHGAD
jgi:hypothetical protein